MSFPVDGQTALGLLDDPDRRTVVPLEWNIDGDGLLIVGIDEADIASSAATAVCVALDRPGVEPVPTFMLDGTLGGSSELRSLVDLDPVIDVVGLDEPDRLVKAVAHLGAIDGPVLVVIHDWQSVADALGDHGGPAAVERLVRLVRRGSAGATRVIVTARSDRDVPQRAAASLGCRVVHRLADPAGYLSFGLRSSDVLPLRGAGVVDGATGLVGMIAHVDAEARWSLAARLHDRWGTERRWPGPIRVLADRVERDALPAAIAVPRGWRLPVGLDLDLSPHWVELAPSRPVVVLAHHGGGRTTAIATLTAAVPDGPSAICVIDDADMLADEALAARLERAKEAGQPVVLSCGPASAKRFGSTIAGVMANATVLFLNPTRLEGEVVRLSIPDLSDDPIGRAVAVDRGRVTVVQVAG